MFVDYKHSFSLHFGLYRPSENAERILTLHFCEENASRLLILHFFANKKVKLKICLQCLLKKASKM